MVIWNYSRFIYFNDFGVVMVMTSGQQDREEWDKIIKPLSMNWFEIYPIKKEDADG